jgi:ADP-heptose:LPS heptosyltransferase/glycosyltransferase involved in cell wall biosynthesis
MPKTFLKDLGRKPKILFVNEASFLRTGFSTIGWQIMRRLAATGKYDLVELASYAKQSDPRWKDPTWGISWRYYSAIPEDNDQEGIRAYQQNYHYAQFGSMKFDEVLLKEKPDIVIDIRDRWMASEWQLKSPYRKFFTYIYMPCVDSHPPQPDWVKDYKDTDYILGFSWYAKHILEREGIKCWAITHPGVDLQVFNTNKSRKEVLERWGFRDTVKPILGVFRNQKRKLLPELVYSYLILKNEHPEAYKNTALWIHTSWPDVGFNIDLVMKWAMEGRIPDESQKNKIKEKKYKIPLRPSDVYFSYICNSCGHTFVSPYVVKGMDSIVRNLETGQEKIEKSNCEMIHCQKCGKKTARMPNTQYGFKPEDFADVYRSAYCFVQPAIAGADEMPMNEAKACGTPVLAPTHAAMHEKVEKVDYCPDDRYKGGMPIEIASMFTESETMQQRCYFDKNHLTKQLARILTDTALHDRLAKEAVEVTQKYYNWDDIAKTWDNFLWNTCAIDTENKSWSVPLKLKEYGAFTVPTPEQMDNDKFIKWCYSNFLQVDKPDEGGYTNWMNDLNNGRSRESITDFFKQQADAHNEREHARAGKVNNKVIKLSDFIDPKDKFRILVVMPKTAGDIHLLTGTLKALHKKFAQPDPWGIYVSCEDAYKDILKNLPFVKGILPYSQNLDSAVAAERSGLFNICYTPHIITQRYEHYVHNGYGKHLFKAYADMCDVEPEQPEVWLEPIKMVLDKFYVIHAKTSMVSKDWPIEYFKGLVRLFPHVQFVQIGGKKDPAINEPNVCDLRGHTTFNQMAYVIRKADGIIGLDSVALHVASTVGTRSIGIFAATHAHLCGPLNTHGGTIVTSTQRPPGCPQPCHMIQCPDKNRPCISTISVRAVAEAMEKHF